MGRTLARSEIAEAIKDGKYDSDLEQIQHAIGWRKRVMFRKGARVKLVGLTKMPQHEGAIGTVIKVNQSRITVGLGKKDQFGYEHELLVPVGMLQLV